MANEFQRMPNPDNVPGLVTTGYQRQNTNMYAIQTGIDTTEPFDNGQGVITIPAGGIVEVNGVLFKITSNVTLNKGVESRAYWISIFDNGDGTANALLATRPGVWNPAKQGCYRSSGNRTLNWVSLGSLYQLNEDAIFSQSVKGTWELNLRKGWYYVELASGKGGGNGGNGGNSTSASSIGAGGSAGIANITNTITRPFFHDGYKQLNIKIGGNGDNGVAGSPGYWGTLIAQGGSGGGGGGAGEESSISGLFYTGMVRGGSGGAGGKASGATNNVNGGGGGGGGGYGIGGASNSFPGKNGYSAQGGLSTDEKKSGGDAGYIKPDGTSGGYCRIYQLAN